MCLGVQKSCYQWLCDPREPECSRRGAQVAVGSAVLGVFDLGVFIADAASGGFMGIAGKTAQAVVGVISAIGILGGSITSVVVRAVAGKDGEVQAIQQKLNRHGLKG